MDQNTAKAAAMRYRIMMHRRSAPPRCHPVSILIMILCTGILFMGVTMTTISHWPGNSTIGYNPLKIAGPVMLCTGFLGLLCGVIIACYFNNRERRKFVETINRIHAAATNRTTTYSMTSRGQGERASGQVMMPAVRASKAESTTEATNSSLDQDRTFASDPDPDIPEPLRIRKAKKNASKENVNADDSLQQLTTFKPREQQEPDSSFLSSLEYTDEFLLEELEEPSGGKTKTPDTSRRTLPSPPSPGELQRLRIHIKASPGTTVKVLHGSKSDLRGSLESDL